MLICHAYIDINDFKSAELSVASLIQVAPNAGYSHYLMGKVQFHLDKKDVAMEHARSAIAFEPEDAEYRHLEGQIHFYNKDWTQALASADKGLSLDASNLNCLNLRSNCLIKLNRKDEAKSTMDKALDRDAENAYTHASTGWNFLEAGDHVKALEHFTQSLKLDPQNESAKVGMKEALKAKKIFYRYFLKYSFWMSKMKSSTQWMLILGAYFGIQALGRLADQHPEISVFVVPVILVYVIFALSTWVIAPIANVFLRTDPQGKLALTAQEIRVGNFTALSLTLFFAGLSIALWGLFTGHEPNPLHPLSLTDGGYVLMGVGFLMLLPLAQLLKATDRNRTLIRIACLILLGLGVAAIVFVWGGNPLLGEGTMPFLYGMFIYQFVGSYLASRG